MRAERWQIITKPELIGFGIVWTALIIFGLEGFLNYRMQPMTVVVE